MSIVNSIRTRYSLITAAFVLVILAIFYIGGRIVLIHLVRDTEKQVTEIGHDITRIAYSNAEQVKVAAMNAVERWFRHEMSERAFLSDSGRNFSIAARFSGDAKFVGGAIRNARNELIDLTWEMFEPYADTLTNWVTATNDHLDEKLKDAAENKAKELAAATTEAAENAAATNATAQTVKIEVDAEDLTNELDIAEETIVESKDAELNAMRRQAATGIIRIADVTHYVAVVRLQDGCLMLGMRFDEISFNTQVNESFAGAEIRITNRKADVHSPRRSEARHINRCEERSVYGIAPMLSEAISFYSGGFWELGASPFEAVFAVRDISGNAISMVSVSIPKTFSNVTQQAIGRFTIFVAIGGICFILPIFWVQSRMLLNPLTKMTNEVSAIGARSTFDNCPRLNWRGKDEFSSLADSVNRMIEVISTRTIAAELSERNLHATLDAIPDTLAVFDRAYRLVSVLKEDSHSGPFPCAIPGQKFQDVVFGEEGRLKFEDAIDKAFQTGSNGEPLRLRLNHASWVPADVPSKHYEVRVVRIDGESVLACIRDISVSVVEHNKLVMATERLRENEKRESLSMLAAGIAHDVNNVLAAIGNTASATWSGTNDPKEISALATIDEALKRGSSMMRELMDYAGQSRISLVRTAPKDILGGSNLVLQSIARDVELNINIPDNLPFVDIDPNQFWKVFMNIVKNAVEAIGDRPGNINIHARAHELSKSAALMYKPATLEPGKGVLFTISDNGPGIHAEMLSRMFDPFVSSKSLGRGLGLATVSAIVESHSGGIRVASRLEQGTVFSIFLPESQLPPAPEEMASQENNSEKSMVSTVGGEVLIVDDDEAILKTISILMRAIKFTAHVAKDSKEAVKIIRHHADSISSIILDANLNGMSTVRLAETFRNIAPDLPIIISSGSSESQVRKYYSEGQYDAFLGKPYTMMELKAVLAKFSRKS